MDPASAPLQRITEICIVSIPLSRSRHNNWWCPLHGFFGCQVEIKMGRTLVLSEEPLVAVFENLGVSKLRVAPIKWKSMIIIPVEQESKLCGNKHVQGAVPSWLNSPKTVVIFQVSQVVDSNESTFWASQWWCVARDTLDTTWYHKKQPLLNWVNWVKLKSPQIP